MVTKIMEPRRSAPDVVRDGLREAILSGDLTEGTQLRQDQLAEQFGISRIPVREALRQLETEGLVKIEPNRGAIVASLSLDDVLEMLDIRIALECHALRLAIPEMAEEDFSHAESILEGYNREPNPESWGSMNWQFHWSIYAPCHRPRLLSMIEANYGHVNRFVRMQVSLAAGKERPRKEHELLLALCREGDIEQATALLETHIEQTKKSVQASRRHRS
ncbi:GntR family transcriptional regulator [Rhizobium rhizogenes]|uniref:GntR family transcriptional regulator n=1 Tax=Rhizobium rhizogenes NBRC 13257 TaxID=1220581 RepID=A0AA87Q702_RHIRH|nr:GntR family transcriptional regulator [Rhizobium rhizogenes]GAJ96720.1 putative GntR family transcriptional regulator [Rhizobium rhizogenes NBRC 13257]